MVVLTESSPTQKILQNFVTSDGLYRAQVIDLSDAPRSIYADTMPETRWHAWQTSFNVLAHTIVTTALHIERTPSAPELALVDTLIVPWKLRIVGYRIDDDLTLVVMMQQGHPVTKSLSRSVRRLIQKLSEVAE